MRVCVCAYVRVCCVVSHACVVMCDVNGGRASRVSLLTSFVASSVDIRYPVV
jgi:hypothetical protein